MTAWQIVLYVVVIILIFYIALLTYVLISITNFRLKIKKHISGFRILLSEKKDLLLFIYAIFDKEKAIKQTSLNESCAKVRWLKCENIEAKEVVIYSDIMSDFENRLAYIASEYPFLKEKTEYVESYSMLKDINLNFRRQIVLFNKDASGYMYWRKFFITRPVLSLFNFEKYERLS